MEINIGVHPNPFVSELSIVIGSNLAVIALIRLTNDTGSLAIMKSCSLHQGENHIIIDKLSRFGAGNYYLEVRLLNGDKIISIPLVKE